MWPGDYLHVSVTRRGSCRRHVPYLYILDELLPLFCSQQEVPLRPSVCCWASLWALIVQGGRAAWKYLRSLLWARWIALVGLIENGQHKLKYRYLFLSGNSHTDTHTHSHTTTITTKTAHTHTHTMCWLVACPWIHYPPFIPLWQRELHFPGFFANWPLGQFSQR